MELGHLPVMPVEVLGTLAPAPGSLQIDATVGGGGHTERILEAASPDGRVLGLDADQAAIERVALRLARFGDRLVLRQANFRELASVAPAAGFGAVDGALFDLGLSSFQLADRDRGFGFRAGGPLDMRFDTDARRARRPSCSRPSTPTSSPRCSASTARSRPPGRSPRPSSPPARPRRSRPPRTWPQLVERVSPVNPRQRRRIHPATRVFQALRIAVNEELDALPEGPRRRRRPAAARAAASSSCPTTRSRTASSSASSPPSAAAASARPRRRLRLRQVARACAS